MFHDLILVLFSTVWLMKKDETKLRNRVEHGVQDVQVWCWVVLELVTDDKLLELLKDHYNMGISIVMEVPQARWMVYFMESPNLKWMMNRGTPNLGNLHI